MNADFTLIQKAREIIRPYVTRTQQDHSIGCSLRVGFDVALKLENRQRTGSFKIRGAAHKLSSLTTAERAKGIIAYSAGNHAQGVAFMAKQLGVKAVIVMPQASPLVKVASTKGYGAEVHLHGTVIDEAFQYLLELQKKHGYILVHPFEDPLIISGQGTIGIEILEDCPDADTVFVPIGGGGLISGIAMALKAQKPQIRVVGVQAQGADGMAQMFKTGAAQKPKSVSTIADGIAVKYPSVVMYETYIKKHVDDVITVGDSEIAEAMLFAMENEKVVVEGAGAAALAGLFAGRAAVPKPRKAVVVLSGGNVDSNLIEKVVERGLQRSGRLANITVRVPDVPGSLTKLTTVIAEKRANVIQIFHNRVSDKLLLGETAIEFTLETLGPEHIEAIKTGLQDVGAILL